MLGLVLGTLRLPFIVLATGSPIAAAGTNIAISAAVLPEHTLRVALGWVLVVVGCAFAVEAFLA